MTQGYSKRKTILRSSIVVVLLFSIFLSSFSISYASADAPETIVNFNDLITSSLAQDWVASCLEQDPNSYIVVWDSYDSFWDEHWYFIYWVSADVAFYVDNSNMYANSRTGMTGKYYSQYHPESLNNCTNQYPGNNSFPMDGSTWYAFDGGWGNRVNTFYCSTDFKDNGGDRTYNLDLTNYLPPQYYLEAHLSTDKEFIWVDVNFDVDVFPSMVSIWGYNDYGATPYNYVRDEYIGLQYDMGTDGIHSIFKIPLAPFRAQYLGQDFTIQSISVIGWDEVGHEEWLSLGWHLSDLTPGEYNPPTTNYYNTYVYDSNYYTAINRVVVNFGNVKIRIHSDNEIGNVFWDNEETTITPYKYSYLFLPQIDWVEGYDQVINELCLEYDLIFTNCSDTLVDSIYGNGTAAHMRDYLSTTTRLFAYYLGNLNLYYHKIPYSFRDNLPNTYTEYSCGCLYTDSFYMKSLAYFFGDNNNLLLELETRLFDEDGSFDLLFKNMKNSYDNDFDYYSKMITYMDKLNYLTYVITDMNYFENVLKYLKTISEKDFTIDLPEFDFTTVLGKYPDSNLSNLTDFISHSVSDLPTWDFSSLSTFTDAIGDLFTSVAPDGEFIENISNPYSFGDSVEDDLFPD